LPGTAQGIVGLLGPECFGKESQLQGPSEQLRHVSHIQPSHQIESVHLDRADADIEHLRNLAVRVSDRHQAKDIALSRCEELDIELFLWQLEFSVQSSPYAHQWPLIVDSRESSKGLSGCKRNDQFVQGFVIDSHDRFILAPVSTMPRSVIGTRSL